MGFNSLTFVGFFAIVYALYLLSGRSHKAQNLLLLIASYVFYGYWDVRFLSLLFTSTVVDYVVGLRLERADDQGKRKLLLATSVVVNLGLLGAFKYFDFFASSFSGLLGAMGLEATWPMMNIVLPVGISFYTFQTMSYTIDIYRRKLEPTRSFVSFALFVSFFPQLVAGPIERARNLLPQISTPRRITVSVVNAAVFLILWGYFKKLVIADNLAPIVDSVFDVDSQARGLAIVVGTLAFTAQIYCDFSGYSDIARGLARLMGFELMLNFRLPFFALNPRDLWSRWHISLSTWLRDYLYVPVGGNRGGKLATYRNLLITMTLGGLWHGAMWHRVVWGFSQGVFLVLHRVAEDLRGGPPLSSPGAIGKAWRMALTFASFAGGLIIFRAESMTHAIALFQHIGFHGAVRCRQDIINTVFLCSPLVVMQIVQHLKKDLLVVAGARLWWQIPVYSLLALGLLVFGAREAQRFIYFQF